MENSWIIQSLIYAFMILVLIVIAVIDLKRKAIDQKLLLVLLLGSIAAIYTNQDLNIYNAISATILIFIMFSLVHYISRKALGFGDVKLCSCIAPYLGIEKSFSMLFIAMIVCGLAALILLCVNKSNKYKELPFAPFAAIGTIVVLIF
jgi:prepilin signal peptidase PulO-like enzyme (type II secretory pathway)